MTDQKYYSMVEVAKILQREIPEVRITRNMVHNWVIKNKLVPSVSFPQAPTSDKLTYRISEENLGVLKELTRQWADQVLRGLATNEQ